VNEVVVGNLADVFTMRHDLLALVQRAARIRLSPESRPEHKTIRQEAYSLQHALVAICPHPPLVVPDEDLRQFSHSLPLWLTGARGPFCWCCTARRISIGAHLSYYTIPQP
jgi:hypothetical protein